MVPYPAALDLPHALVEWVTMLIVTREGDRRCKLLPAPTRAGRPGVPAQARHPCPDRPPALPCFTTLMRVASWADVAVMTVSGSSLSLRWTGEDVFATSTQFSPPASEKDDFCH